MELQTLKNRVEFAIDRLGFKSVAAFERHLGWGGGSVSSLKDTLTDKRIQSLKTAFPNLNIDFLLNGSGNLFLSQSQSKPNAVEDGSVFIEYPEVTSEDNDTLKKRMENVIEILKDKKLIKNQAEFAEQCGYKNSFFSQIINQHVKMPKDFADKVRLAFKTFNQDFDISWLSPKTEQSAKELPFDSNQDEMLSVGTQLNTEILSLLKDEFAEKSFQIREILNQNRMLIEGYNSLLTILKQQRNVQ